MRFVFSLIVGQAHVTDRLKDGQKLRTLDDQVICLYKKVHDVDKRKWVSYQPVVIDMKGSGGAVLRLKRQKTDQVGQEFFWCLVAGTKMLMNRAPGSKLGCISIDLERIRILITKRFRSFLQSCLLKQ